MESKGQQGCVRRGMEQLQYGKKIAVHRNIYFVTASLCFLFSGL